MKKIQLGDGRTVVVDEARYNVFDQNRSELQNLIASGGMVRDAQEAVGFVISQLAYTETQVFERKYLPLQYEQLLPISFEAGEWAETIRYETSDHAGRGKRHNQRSKDIPKVDSAWGEKSMPVLGGAIGYDYTIDELRKSAYLRKPISVSKMNAAVEGYRRHMNEVGLYGEVAAGVTGLFNNAVIPQGSAPTGNWAAATPAQILNDINTLIQNVWSNTAYNDQITDIVMSPAKFAYISSTPRSDNSDKTILQYIKENNVAKVEKGIDIKFSPGYGLDTAGVGSTHRMLGYVKSDQRLVMHIPLPLRFLAPQLSAMLVEVPGEYKYSGVEWRYPKSAYYMDGI
jgi:hypothetical protein